MIRKILSLGLILLINFSIYAKKNNPEHSYTIGAIQLSGNHVLINMTHSIIFLKMER